MSAEKWWELNLVCNTETSPRKPVVLNPVHFNHLENFFLKKCLYLDPGTIELESSGRACPEHVFFFTLFVDDSDLQLDDLLFVVGNEYPLKKLDQGRGMTLHVQTENWKTLYETESIL